MPIRLTWTAPLEEGAGVIAYKIYKVVNPGPLTQANAINIVNGNVFLYDDYAYNRRLLQGTGYLYKVTALSQDGESDFNASNEVLITHSFEDFVYLEEWEFAFTGVDILELFEEWNITLPSIFTPQYLEDWNYSLTPNEEYMEGWEDLFTPTITEPWEYPPPSYIETSEYIETWGFAPIFLWLEPWDLYFAYHADFLWLEPWDYFETINPVLEWVEPWEYFEITNPVFEWVEPWDYFETINPVLEWLEPWEIP